MRILLTGRDGQIGWELLRCLDPLGQVFALDRVELDLARDDVVRGAIRELRPDVIANAAAYTAVDRAEDEPALVEQVNARAQVSWRRRQPAWVRC